MVDDGVIKHYVQYKCAILTPLRMIVSISQAMYSAFILNCTANQNPNQWHHGHT